MDLVGYQGPGRARNFQVEMKDVSLVDLKSNYDVYKVLFVDGYRLEFKIYLDIEEKELRLSFKLKSQKESRYVIVEIDVDDELKELEGNISIKGFDELFQN